MIDDYSGLQKAAILLITLGPEKASAIFQHLKEDEIESLTLEIANTRSVSPQDKESVLDEYYQVCLAQQYIAEGGIGYAKELLEKALGSEKAQGVISKLTASLQVRPFEFVRKTEPAQLLNFIQDEHPQTIAMILSYLSSSQAAMILGALPPEKQADVARRIAQMDRTSPDVIKEVERVLERKLSSLVNQDYTIVGGIDSIVNILNSVDRATEKRIMESLEVDEPELAEEIRKKMFVFEDILLLDDRSIQRVLRDVENADLELEFGYGIIPLADVNQGGDLLDRVVMIRRQIALELGTVVPIIRLRDNIQLNPNQYIIKIKGIQVTEGEILFDHYMAMNPGYVEEEITGIPTFEPSFHLPAIWITESQRERAESLGYTVVDPPSIIATHLTEVIRSHIAELLTRQDVQNLVNNLKESNPVIVDELIPKLLGLGEIQKVLQNLLSEGISIRDLLTIFETLADHAQTTRDTDVLTEYVRQGLKRAISSKYFPANETTSVITLDPAVEQEIMSSVKQTEQGSYLSLDPDRIKAIIKSVETEIGKLESLGKSAIIITSPIVRMYFKKMTEDYFKDLIVLSYNEVESNVELQSVGMVTA